MNQKWNLQDIRPAEPKRKRPPQRIQSNGAEANQEADQNDAAPERAPEDNRIPVTNGTKKSKRGIYGIVALVAVLVVGTIGISALMAGADVTVYPQHHKPTVNSAVTAYPEPRDGELSYEIMTLTATEEKQVTATGEEEVEERAEGEIEIVKSTPGSQLLVENTRFESPDGRIFRTTEQVEVPGATQDEGGSSPGSIRVTVVADEPGEEYNYESGTRFTIPGFAEGGFTDLFEAMYAENRSDIRGGFSGPQYVIEPDELSTARQTLQMDLRDRLVEQMHNERPAEFVLFTDAVTFTYEQLPAVEYGDELVTIKEEATLRVPIFEQNEFAAYIADASIPSYDDSPVRIDNLDEFSFSYDTDIPTGHDITSETSLEFTLVGEPEIVWTFDEAAFKQELLGESRDALRFYVAESAALERGEARIRPFWSRSYPTDPELIEVTEVLTKW